MFVNSGVLICISTFQNIFGSNFLKTAKKMETNKVTVNGILQSVYLKNLKVLTVKDGMSSNF